MARLIDADSVLQSMKIVIDQCKTLDDTIVAANMIGIVENAPTVDAEPVRYGEWIDVRGGYLFECSRCKAQVNSKQFKSNLKSCPNCRAKMLEEGKNERI